MTLLFTVPFISSEMAPFPKTGGLEITVVDYHLRFPLVAPGLLLTGLWTTSLSVLLLDPETTDPHRKGPLKSLNPSV